MKRLIENKERKYKKEIIKFSRAIEKYYETYNSDNKIRSSSLSKTKKINKFLERLKNAELLDLKNFYLSLHRHLLNCKNNFFLIEFVKNKDEYELNNVVLAKGLKEFIPKNDEIWKNFKSIKNEKT